MAYVALINLRNTIRCLNDFSRLSDLPYSFDTIDFPYEDIELLKKFIKKLDERSMNGRVKAFYEKIREAAHRLEDAIESVLSDLILIAQSEQSIGHVCHWMDCICCIISKMMGDDYSILRPCSLPRTMVKALNSPDAFYYIWENVYIFATYVAVVGMAGIGKTALAREAFDDPWISYEHRVWLTIGPKYEFKRILVDILAQLDPKVDKMHTEDDETLIKHISSILSAGKRCFMVLDDVWDKGHRSYLSKLLQVIKCEVLLTTRLWGVAYGSSRERVHEMELLNEEESWSLLRERVFGEELWPRELEKPGKLIAENCEGLPLMVVTVASLLSKADDKTPEYWNEVAKNKNSIFELAYLKISKVLYPSYKNLDLEFRACFLYMAAFPVKYEIPIHNLFILHNVEGIIPSGSWDSDNYNDYLEVLYRKSLLRTPFIVSS